MSELAYEIETIHTAYAFKRMHYPKYLFNKFRVRRIGFQRKQISLKIFGFIQQAGQSRQKIFRSGIAFTLGIFAWFILG